MVVLFADRQPACHYTSVVGFGWVLAGTVDWGRFVVVVKTCPAGEAPVLVVMMMGVGVLRGQVLDVQGLNVSGLGGVQGADFAGGHGGLLTPAH